MDKNTSHNSQESSPNGSFETQLIEAARSVQHAFSQLVAVSGVNVRGVEIAEALGIDKSLAWHVASLVNATNPAVVIEHLPSIEGVELILNSSLRRKALPDVISAVRQSVNEFEALQERVAGDRSTLLAMLSGFDGANETADRAMLLARKQAFRSNARIFGMHATTVFQIDCVFAQTGTDRLSLSTLRGWHGLTRLRPDVFIRVGGFRMYADGTVKAGTRPLDPRAAAEYNAPVVAAFSTPNLPAFQIDDDRLNVRNIYVSRGDVGLTGAQDICLGETMSDGPSPYAQHQDERAEFLVRHYVPSMSLVHDVLVHKNISTTSWRNTIATVEIVGEMSGASMFPMGRNNKTPLIRSRTLPRISRADIAPIVNGLPSHRHMLPWLAQSVGATLDQFEMYRFELAYPPLPSTSIVALAMPMTQVP